ncbi:AAA family ATPase [Candidatus Hydrogenedentota bacterium]
MTKLVFIGGAPGVGKSTIASELLGRVGNSVWLDGDDLWRMQPFIVNEATKDMVEKNIQFVLRSFLRAEFAYVFFTWVLHDRAIVDRLLKGLDGEPFQFSMFTLVCDKQTLLTRLSQDSRRTTGAELALERLRQTQLLSGVKIDTVDKEQRAVCEDIIQNLVV